MSLRPALSEDLREWYRIKPYAMTLFNDSNPEICWIKNALLCALRVGACGESMDPAREDISDDERLWLLALWDLFRQYKNAVDYNPVDFVIEDWCASIGVIYIEDDEEYEGDEYLAFRHDALMERLKGLQKLYAAALTKAYPDSYDRYKFFNNELTLMTRDEFLFASSDLEESTIEDDNEWFAYEEERYSEYCNDRIVARNENQGFESMSRLVG